MENYHPTRFSEILAFLIDAPVLFLVYMIVAHGDPSQAFYRPIFLMCAFLLAISCWLHIRARDSISVDSDGLTIRFCGGKSQRIAWADIHSGEVIRNCRNIPNWLLSARDLNKKEKKKALYLYGLKGWTHGAIVIFQGDTPTQNQTFEQALKDHIVNWKNCD